MTDVVHVGLNEGPPQVFTPYDNRRPEWWAIPVAATAWEAYQKAERDLKAAEADYASALQALLAAMKANEPPDRDDSIQTYVVEGGRIYFP
jgi:hypothetical protein